MKKCFIFNDPTKNYENIIKFLKYLLAYSSYQTIIDTRFKNLIHRLNKNKKSIPQSAPSEDSTKKRKSYLIRDDLQEDLIESGCESFMFVNNGKAEIALYSSPNKFIIDM